MGRAAWRSAKVGFRVASYVVGPIATLLLILSLMPTMFGLGAGRGFGIHPFVLSTLALYPFAAFLGLLVGTLLGVMVFSIRVALRLTGTNLSGASATGPNRLFKRRRDVAGSGETRATPRPRRWRLVVWLVAVPTILILGTSFGAGVYAGRLVDRRLAEAIAATDHDDPNWRFDDHVANLEVVPDNENGAIVVNKVYAMVPDGWRQDEVDVLDPPRDANLRMDDDEAAAIRDDLATHEDAVLLARTVAEYRRGSHDLMFLPAIIDTLLTETAHARTVARVLVSDAAARAHNGDIDGALNSARAILGVARSIGDEPFLISGFVRIAIGGMAVQAAREALAKGEASEPVLARLQAELRTEMAEPLLLRGLRFERASMDEIIRRIRDAENPVSAISGTDTSGDPVPPVSPWGKLAFDNQRAIGLEWMGQAIAAAKQPSWERAALWKALDEKMVRTKESPYSEFTATLSLLLMPSTQGAAAATSRHQSELGAVVIVLACERHRLKTGSWPESIAAIDPQILPDPPLDPYTGQPYLMERKDDGIVIHTIGANLQDEHGEFNYRTAMKGGPDDYGSRAWDPSRRNQPAPQ